MASMRITRSGARRVPQAQVAESPQPAVRTPPATPEHGPLASPEYTEDVLKSPALRKYKRRRSNLGMAARVRTPSKADAREGVDENKDPQAPEPVPMAPPVAAAEPPVEKIRNRASSVLNSNSGVTLKRGDNDSFARISSIFSDRDSSGKRKYSSTSSDGSESSRTSASEEELKHRCWKVDDFNLGLPLGRGKYGNVYHGKEKITRFSLAIKILFKDRFVQEEALYILKREVSIQYRLRHRNIVSLYGCFEDKKNLYLLLEFCGQGELFKLLRKHRHLPEGDAQRYIAQITDALKYMHARNVIHRDIKPENMLLAEDGSLKIADFGWAVHAPAPHNVRRTLCGTPEYLAPEVLSRSGHTWAVDIWGLGIMAYELLCGHTPFVEKSRSPILQEGGQDEEKPDKLQQIYDRILAYQDDITLPHSVVPGLSQEAEDFVRSCLTSNPAARPSAGELLNTPWLSEV